MTSYLLKLIAPILLLAGYTITPIQETSFPYYVPDNPNYIPQETIVLGADATLPSGLSTYNISGAGINSSATSITLASLTIPQNGYELVDADFSDTFYITIEPGSRKYQEFVSCTTVTQGAGTTATLSGCTRGLSPIPDYAASSTLQFPHAGGSQVIFSNSPQFYNQFLAKNNDETITGTYTFTSTKAPKYDTAYSAVGNEFVSYNQLNGVVVGDVGTSTESALGLVQLATAADILIGTASSSAGGPLVIPSKLATSSNDVATTHSIVSLATGYLKQNFLNLTEAFSFSGNNTYSGTSFFTASTTHTATTTIIANSLTNNALVLNSLAYEMPSVRGASSTVPFEDGTGRITWQEPSYAVVLTSVASTTAVKASADTERSTTESTYTILKSIRIYHGGTINASFACKYQNATGKAKIYINGVAVGTERACNATSYVYWDETVNVQPSDFVQIYALNDTGGGTNTTYIKEFRIFYTKALSSDTAVITN